MPIVTYNTTKPGTLTTTMRSETGIFDFKMKKDRAEPLRYLLGRALDPASTPALTREAFD